MAAFRSLLISVTAILLFGVSQACSNKPAEPKSSPAQTFVSPNPPIDYVDEPRKILAPDPYENYCIVDFSDEDALSLLPNHANDSFAYDPWWHQECSSGLFVEVRPLSQSHYHLGYDDPDIVCYEDGEMQRKLEDGTCEPVNHIKEPRYLRSHDGNTWIHIFVWDGESKVPFTFGSLRNRSNPAIRVCYKKAEGADESSWIVNSPDESVEWTCFDTVDTGHWYFSLYSTDVIEVKITGTNGSFSIDDIVLILPE